MAVAISSTPALQVASASARARSPSTPRWFWPVSGWMDEDPGWYELRSGELLHVDSALNVIPQHDPPRATAQLLHFSKEDEIVVVSCGSQKSLANGLPMAKLLFVGPALSLVVLPLMIFHQLQLMVCATLAQRYARRPNNAQESVVPSG